MPRQENVRLTREQLYELVWSKPMTEIAADFGMSSVAFAKYCKAADVPRPGRGNWQQIEHGQKRSRDRLPKPGARTPSEIVITRYTEPARSGSNPECFRVLREFQNALGGDEVLRYFVSVSASAVRSFSNRSALSVLTRSS